MSDGLSGEPSHRLHANLTTAIKEIADIWWRFRQKTQKWKHFGAATTNATNWHIGLRRIGDRRLEKVAGAQLRHFFESGTIIFLFFFYCQAWRRSRVSSVFRCQIKQDWSSILKMTDRRWFNFRGVQTTARGPLTRQYKWYISLLSWLTLACFQKKLTNFKEALSASHFSVDIKTPLLVSVN